jgi:membrane protease YdiL (CAAX protease family)
MTFLAAAAWSFGARLGLDLLILAVIALQPRARLDAVTLVLCQAAAFLGMLYALLRAHAPDRPLVDSLALRPTPIVLCLVAAALGLTLHPPFDRLADLIAQHLPPSPDEIAAQAEAFAATDLLHRCLIVIAAGVVAPLIEELFFRGGIYRSLRREHTTTLAVMGTAFIFAISHLSIRTFVPVFAVGLILSHARAASGSLWPGLTLHIVFNTATLVESFRNSPERQGLAMPPSLAMSLCSIVLSLGLLYAYHAVAQRNAACGMSRKRDLS